MHLKSNIILLALCVGLLAGCGQDGGVFAGMGKLLVTLTTPAQQPNVPTASNNSFDSTPLGQFFASYKAGRQFAKDLRGR